MHGEQAESKREFGVIDALLFGNSSLSSDVSLIVLSPPFSFPVVVFLIFLLVSSTFMPVDYVDAKSEAHKATAAGAHEDETSIIKFSCFSVLCACLCVQMHVNVIVQTCQCITQIYVGVRTDQSSKRKTQMKKNTACVQVLHLNCLLLSLSSTHTITHIITLAGLDSA